MTFLSSLIENSSTLVLDTSVMINLHASTYGERILDALPNNIVVPDVVIHELEHESRARNGNGELAFVNGLLARGKAEMVSLDDRSFEVFGRLISQTPSLGDGEAATIAVADSVGHLPVIDDGKGRTTAALISGQSPLWSLDLLLHPKTSEALTSASITEAVFLALSEGRMRIDAARCDDVVSMIGTHRALQCPSLPGFKWRKKIWLSETAHISAI